MTEKIEKTKEKRCLDMDCRDCDWVILKGDKPDCNYNNRLGMGQVDVTTLLQNDPDFIKDGADPVLE